LTSPAEWEKEEGRLASALLAAGDPTGWFDQLNAAGASGQVQMPWSRIDPHPLFTGWAQGSTSDRIDTWAVVVGCGRGVDANTSPASVSMPSA
jgi:hypothetical protein